MYSKLIISKPRQVGLDWAGRPVLSQVYLTESVERPEYEVPGWIKATPVPTIDSELSPRRRKPLTVIIPGLENVPGLRAPVFMTGRVSV